MDVFFGDSGEEERMKRQTFIPGTEPERSHCKSSTPSTKPLPGTKVCRAGQLVGMTCMVGPMHKYV